MSDTKPAEVWVWEYSSLNGITVYSATEYADLAAAKAAVDASFSDYTWEEVERRGIRGTSVLVKQNGRYVDTGHWVYRKPQFVPQTPFSVTWDHDFLYLWCAFCRRFDGKPVGSFAGNPTDMSEIDEARRKHADWHAEDH